MPAPLSGPSPRSLAAPLPEWLGFASVVAQGDRSGYGKRPSRRILLVTNLFPPQEYGGYGRMMWELAHGLIARGHEVRVLTADLPAAAKAPVAEEEAMETCVERSLQLLGEWRAGRPVLAPRRQAAARMQHNLTRLRGLVQAWSADLVLAGNLDFLGPSVIEAALAADVPVLHTVAGASPGYGAAAQPCSPAYWMAPCSDWSGAALRQGGYLPARNETLYPGVRLSRFTRLQPPENSGLRVCSAGLLLPSKGVQVLIRALGDLRRRGVDVAAEIAGEAPDAAFFAELTSLVRTAGVQGRVQFLGFLDRRRLAALFARSNVLVFPSQIPEPFGLAQVEGLAAGLAVVTSGTGGAREVVRAGLDGLHFEAEDAADLADKLEQLANDPALLAQLQAAGPARAREFSVERAAARLEARMEALRDLRPARAELAYADADRG